MRTLHILLICLFISYTSAYSQEYNWRMAPFNEQSNFYDILSKNRDALKNQRAKKTRGYRKEKKQFERWANFWKDRVLPNGHFVSAAHNYNEWVKENKRHENLNHKKTTNTWNLVGPVKLPTSSISFYPGMGRINTVAFHGTNTNILYVGAPGGGVWKTVDAGKTWTAYGDGFPNMGVSDIVIHPTNTNILYLATGDWDGVQNRSLGVLKSTDAGETWNTTGLTFTLGQNNRISKLLIDPNNPNTIFATTLNSIKRSVDGGLNWADVVTENSASFNDIQYKVGSNSIIYATTNSGKFYVSTDNGSNWAVASTPTASGRLDFALTANDSNLILSVDNAGSVRKSVDQGSTWTAVSTIPQFSSQGGYNITIAISPLDANLVLICGVDGWRSKNGGQTWEKYLDGYWRAGNPYFYVHSDHHDMKFVPGTNIAFSANDGGIFKGDASKDIKWEDLSEGIAITQYYNVSGTPRDANKLIAGAQDNDIAIYDGTNGFKGENPGSDGVEGLWDYSGTNIAWTCSQLGTMYRTLDGFATPAQYVATPNGAPFIWELEIHPTDPKTIFGGFSDIYKSTDRGDNWTNLNSNAGTIEFISIAPSNPDVIYVSGRIRVKKTIDGGTTWTDVVLPQIGNVKSIEVHPTNPQEVYLAYSGYMAGKVYKSTDGGTTWTNITGSLPNIPTHKIVYKTGTTDGELFLATDLGVYYRTNTKGDWERLGQGLPNVIVHDIEIHYGTEKLRVATYGRGIWETSIAASVLGTEDAILPKNSVTIFPNPTNNKTFTVSFQNLNGKSNIIVYNIIGSVVKEVSTSKAREEIELSTLPKGMYIVTITNNGKSATKKLILK
ncbi:T9SS type A sorting domain-containing protein [Tenacibaculum amylolyticum]|uniref:T9SS type A sorting domain-containing protein n=1 Tax=Tenacibaculum amylolyticum TaxID=104269 RepID=UPI003895E40C